MIISFDEAAFNRHIQTAEVEKANVQNFIDELQDIAPVTFTDDLLRDLERANSSKIEDEVTKSVNAQLRKAGITLAGIVNAALESSIVSFEILKSKTPINGMIRSLKVENNKVFYPEGFEEDNKAQFQNRVTTPNALACFEAHKKLLEAVKVFNETLEKGYRGRLAEVIKHEFVGNNSGMESRYSMRELYYDRIAFKN